MNSINRFSVYHPEELENEGRGLVYRMGLESGFHNTKCRAKADVYFSTVPRPSRAEKYGAPTWQYLTVLIDFYIFLLYIIKAYPVSSSRPYFLCLASPTICP